MGSQLVLFFVMLLFIIIVHRQEPISKKKKRKRKDYWRYLKKPGSGKKKKKIKSGNGTAAKQWLYVLWNLPYFWTCKVGITGYLDLRVQQIDEDNKGYDFPIFAIKIYGAYQVEQFVHGLCSFMRDRSFKGTGHTERFFVLAIIPAIAISILAWASEYLLYLAIIAILFHIIIFKL